jgi:hypothetical protein
MTGLDSYQDEGRRENIVKGKSKLFNKQSYWSIKRGQKNKKRKKK